ncbi:hypothetical protein [Alkalihalobacillus sp. AL-G]|uniref:hypothetical protein n=1 Tax=Alkalihalobacillus sp. AL-G TaxID=2926399 RepID=UPI00272CB039|nr:hypothetical protein [Alkalihalobacillus sp. AL-G]WLD92469.1 hypothetical protein MOJ78_15830 [Alkalihalobacillus sp. AL-G]
MDTFADLILLVISLFLTKIETLIMMTWAFLDFLLENFWIQFALVTLLLYSTLRIAEIVYRWYMYHNYMHRKIENSLASFIDFELFFRELSDKKRSNGIGPDLKFTKNRLHQYNTTELGLLTSFVRTLYRGYRDLRPGVWVVAFLFGIAASYILNIIDFDRIALSLELVLKTGTIIAFWYLIILFRYTNRKKKVAQLIGLMSVSSKEKQDLSEEDLEIKEFNPSH